MKNYNTKKKITIAALAVVAVLLASGLWIYMDTLNNNEPAALPVDDTTQEQSDVDVPEIKMPKSSSQGTQSSEETSTPPAAPETPEHDPSASGNPSTPPSSTPAPAAPESGIPKSGDKNDKGEIYVPGFGWVPDQGGGVEVEDSDNGAHNGNKVGDM